MPYQAPYRGTEVDNLFYDEELDEDGPKDRSSSQRRQRSIRQY